MEQQKTRIAPTPSGFLHMGNAFSFVLTYILAKKLNAQILLRIDDLDNQRFRPEYLEDIFKSLDWLGIEWDEGPFSIQEFQQQYSQIHRIPLYQKALQNLQEAGLIFPCSCSRLQTQNGHDRKICIADDIKEKSLRINTQNAKLHSRLVDFVVKRKEGIFSYQFASVVDDQYFNCNTIIRGEDLRDSSQAQIWLASYFPGHPFAKALFLHHPLITDKEGNKLSKSLGAQSLHEIRKTKSPTFIYKEVGHLLGEKNIQTLEELLSLPQSRFDQVISTLSIKTPFDLRS